MRSLICTSIIAAVTLGTAFPGYAQPFPGKMIRIVIPFQVGGSSDANARIVAPALTERWKQQIIIDPRPGAATILGTEIVARSAPDGHTLLINSTQFPQQPAMWAKIPYDVLGDITPITRITRSPQAIVAHPSLPVKDAGDLIKLARARPGEINMANAGTPLTSHFFNMLAKTKIETVNYKGAGPMMIDAMGGHVHLAIGAVSSVQAGVRTGRVRLLGTSSPSVAFPDAPLITQAVPGFEAADTWFALFGPRGMAKELVQRIRDDTAAVLQIPEVRQRLLDIGGEPVGEPPEEFAARIRADVTRWLEVAKVAGIKPQ